MGPKIIKSTKFDIAKNVYSFENICRNMYGDVLKLKYFEDSFGVAYFLSLHQRYFLVFLVETTGLGALQTSLIKSVSIPDNEFTGNHWDIVLTGTDRVYLRDDSNAHEIVINDEKGGVNLADHCIFLKISTTEFIFSILTRQDFSKLNINSYTENFFFPEHIPVIESVFSFVANFRDSIDVWGAKAIFLASLRHKNLNTNLNVEYWSDFLDYEILSSSKSDSQVYFYHFYQHDFISRVYWLKLLHVYVTANSHFHIFSILSFHFG